MIRSRSQIARAVAVSGLLLCLSARGEEPKAENENWALASGPAITAADFRAEPPDPLPVRNGVSTYGWSVIDLRWRASYSQEALRRGHKLTITSGEIFAVMLRDQSWLVDKKNAALLDHEQGHLDLARLHAEAAQVELVKKLKGKAISFRAETREKVEQMANDFMAAFVARHFEKNSAEQVAYDTETRYGLNVEAQAAARADHRARLAASAGKAK